MAFNRLYSPVAFSVVFDCNVGWLSTLIDQGVG